MKTIPESQIYKEKASYILKNNIQKVINNVHNPSYFISILIEEYVSIRLHRNSFEEEIFIIISEKKDFFINPPKTRSQ